MGKSGSIVIDDERMIQISISAFGTLRRDLIRNIGVDRTRGFLHRYGWDLGQDDANKALRKKWDSIDDVIFHGPNMHMMNGHAQVAVTKLKTKKKNEQKSVYSVHMEGTWKNSYEASEHLQQFGRAESPICYTLTGYASGYLSTVCKQTCIVKEIQCQAEGHEKCIWVGKSLDYNDEETKDEWQFYERTPIVQELEETYEKLLEERNVLEKSALIHQRLTNEILQGNDLKSIVNTIYEVTSTPGMIVDHTYYPLAYSGLSLKEVKKIMNEFKNHLQQRKTSPSIFTTRKFVLEQYTYLITPIYLQDKIIGYCFFVYPDTIHMDQTTDEMVLEQIALVSSLSLLIEKTKYNTERRIEGHFFEEILRGEFKCEEDVLRRGIYIQIDLSEPYRIITVNYELQECNTQKELTFHEQLLETTTSYFKDKKENLLIGHWEKSIVFLVPISEIKTNEINSYFNHYIRFLSQTYPTTLFVAGVSKISKTINRAKDSYQESLIALRMATPNKRIIFFDSIGVIGPLLNENNENEVKKISTNVLGELLEHAELLETLYAFLLNGGNLEQTSKEISLSLSGLRYRLEKIKKILDQDLKDPFDNYQLLLALQSLILIGEVEFKHI